MKNLWLNVEEFLWLIVFYYCDIMELSDEEELDMEGFMAGFMMWFRTEYDDGQNNAWKCSGSSGSQSRCLTGSLIQQLDNDGSKSSRKNGKNVNNLPRLSRPKWKIQLQTFCLP